jgi:small conductance mechanosensitive channel
MSFKEFLRTVNIWISCVICLFFLFITNSFGEESQMKNTSNELSSSKTPEVSNKIDVNPIARDVEISARIEKILNATTWYINPQVQVKDGVVFLKGETKTSDHKQWAESLSKNTQDVVAVVNHIEVIGVTVGDIQEQIMTGLKKLWSNLVRSLPLILMGLIILTIAWIVALIAKVGSRKYLNSRNIHPLLVRVIARGVAILCYLLGAYFILKLLGLTAIALTVLGGTGVMGLILGIAFKNITENFLASVLLSVQNPFKNDDLIEVAGVTGYVQGLTVRATLLMTQDGHEVQIPNSLVYQNTIYNFTSNPNRRESFLIEISSMGSISSAQELALKTLKDHSAVLQTPEPLVLVDSIKSGNVVLCIYFWMDGKKYNWQKVKSSAIRLIKRAFQDADIVIPGTEVIISYADESLTPRNNNNEIKGKTSRTKTIELDNSATHAEGGLSSDIDDIKKQAQQSDVGDKKQNLLMDSKK